MFCVRKIELNASAPNLPVTLIPKETLADLAQAGHLLENAEAQAQAICMQTRDFERAYHAFVAKEKPEFKGD